MSKTFSLFKILCVVILALCGTIQVAAQSVDYEHAISNIMEDYLEDYPEPTINSLDALFAGINVDELSPTIRFLYYYYYGGCLAKINPEDAILYLTQARQIACMYREVGIRNSLALDAERALAELYFAKGTTEFEAAAMLLYNDIVTVGVSLLDDPQIGFLVIDSLIEQAKTGVKFWLDPNWVEKIWIFIRDLSIELEDSKCYTYYVLNVLKYYCTIGDYGKALSFMNDAKNKEILEVEVTDYIQHISDILRYLSQTGEIKESKGTHSIEYWRNKLNIATLSMVLCNEDKCIKLLQEVERGLVDNNLTESHEYAQVLYLLSINTFEHTEIAESYLTKQVNLLETTPEYFVYTTDTDAYNSLAVCQMKEGKYALAQDNYQKAINCLERDSEYSDTDGYKRTAAIVFHNIGRNLYYVGRYNESIDYLTKSISLQKEVDSEVMPKTNIYISESLAKVNTK